MTRLPALIVLAWCLAVWHRMPPPAILHLAQGRDDLFFSRHGVPRSGEWTLQWFSDNWGFHRQWPVHIPRPTPAARSPYMFELAEAFGLDLPRCDTDPDYARDVTRMLHEFQEFQDFDVCTDAEYAAAVPEILREIA